MTVRRDVYIAIMVAAANGRGVHLSQDEVALLASDDAIMMRAINMLGEGEFQDTTMGGVFSWKTIDPYASRIPANAFANTQ